VLAFDEFGGSAKFAEVLAVHAPRQASYYFVINGDLRGAASHPMLSGGNWVQAVLLNVGDLLTLPNGSKLPIFAIERIDEDVTVFNFAGSSGTFAAGGVVVHNKDLPYEQQPCLEGCDE